ncbi:MAG TPA: isoprenylcysteine carboxylmethyltransferase family protein [Solirubrobacteraceae bacterium]|nr:isoprenylcysteine carboxylmethyltransferase family protein [Solirubrobacteraceae bacterium]
MTPLPYSAAAARIVFNVVLIGFLALEARVRVRSARNPRGRREDARTFALVWLGVAGGVGGAFALATGVPATAIGVLRWPLFVAGIVVMTAGIAVRQWAVHRLGRFFTVDVRVHADQTVVSTGPYRWVRHPSYLGLLMTLLGIGLALGSWAALIVILVLPTAVLVVRIGIEERALAAGLGPAYTEYARGRARLIPGVW